MIKLISFLSLLALSRSQNSVRDNVMNNNRILAEESRSYNNRGGRPYITYIINRPEGSTAQPPTVGPGGPTAGPTGSPPGSTPVPPMMVMTPPQLLGSACQSDADCSGLNQATCRQNQCMCQNGFVALSNIACIPFASFLGDRCVLTSQCAPLDRSAACYEDTCICEPFFNVAVVGRSGSSDQSGHPTNVIGSGAISGGGTTGSVVQRCALKRKLGETCEANQQCAAKIWRAICGTQGRCQCQSGFTAVGNQMCVPSAVNLGDPCTTDNQCVVNIANSECVDNRCVCRRPGFCELTPLSVNTNQNNANDGGLQPGPETRRKRSVVQDLISRTKRQAGNRCVPIRNLGEACENNLQCVLVTRNSECMAGTCQCLSTYRQRATNVNECLPVINVLGGTTLATQCTITPQCTIANSQCNQMTSRCECRQNTCQPTGTSTCLLKLAVNGVCTDTCQCSDRGAVCTSGRCVCPTGTTLVGGQCQAVTLQFSRNSFVIQDFFCCYQFDQQRCILHLGIDPISTETAYTYSISDTSGNLTIDTSNGKLFLNSARTIGSATLSFTATVRSNTMSTVVDTAVVTLLNQPCCTTEAVSLSSSTITVFLMDKSSTTAIGCAGTEVALDASEASNAPNLIDLSTGTVPGNGALDLFVNPCGGPDPTFSSITLDATLTCALVNSVTLSYFEDVQLTSMRAAGTNPVQDTCTVTYVEVTGCNFSMVSSLVLTVVVDGSLCN